MNGIPVLAHSPDTVAAAIVLGLLLAHLAGSLVSSAFAALVYMRSKVAGLLLYVLGFVIYAPVSLWFCRLGIQVPGWPQELLQVLYVLLVLGSFAALVKAGLYWQQCRRRG